MADVITSQIECWSCENGHNWTIDQDPSLPKVSPYDEGYTAACMAKWGYPAAYTVQGVGTVAVKPGDCPLCFAAGAFPVPQLALGTDPANNYAEMSVIDPAKVADLSKQVVTGVDPSTGLPITEEVPLTTDEQTAIQTQAQADLDRMQLMTFDTSQVATAPLLPATTDTSEPTATDPTSDVVVPS